MSWESVAPRCIGKCKRGGSAHPIPGTGRRPDTFFIPGRSQAASSTFWARDGSWKSRTARRAVWFWCRGPSRLWRSGSQSQAAEGGSYNFGLEQAAKSGAELAIDNGAANLEQEIGTAAGP